MADEINRPDVNPDDEFDRLARQPKKKTGNGPIIAMMILGLLLIGGLIFALVYFLGGNNNLDREMLAYLPAETDTMIGVDVEGLLKNDKLKDMFKKVKESPDGGDVFGALKEAGVSEEDISRILVGGKLVAMFEPRAIAVNGKNVVENDPPAATLVVRFKKAVDKARIAKAMQATEHNKNGKTYYQSAKANEGFVYFPTDTMLVATPSEKVLESLLSKDPGQVVVSEEMQELGRKLSKGHIWLAVGHAAFGDKLKNIDEMKGNAPVPAELVEAIKGMKGFGLYAKADGDKFALGAGVLSQDSSAASKAADALQKWIGENLKDPLDQNKNFGETVKKMEPKQTAFLEDLRKSVKADHSGAMLEVSLAFSISGLEDLLSMILSDSVFGRGDMRIEANDLHPVPPFDKRPVITSKEPNPNPKVVDSEPFKVKIKDRKDLIEPKSDLKKELLPPPK